MIKKSHIEYVNEVNKINPNIEVVETYKGARAKILHKCSICGYEWYPTPNSVLTGRGCPKCYSNRHNLTHELYVKKLSTKHPDIELIEQFTATGVPTLHRCKKDGHIWKAVPNNLLQGIGCPVCAGQEIGPAPEYKNSIWASEFKEPLSKYLTEEQLKSYSPHSQRFVNAHCPDCGFSKKIRCASLTKGYFGCSCSDGQSYPNKFVYEVLRQLKIAFIPEYSPEWAGSKRYDIYIPSIDCIIENHGLQHYHGWGWDEESLEKQQSNDLAKYELAKLNKISNYEVLDCSESTLDKIKTAIINSNLPGLLNFTESCIDWDACAKAATKNLIKELSSLYDQEDKPVEELVEMFGLKKRSIQNYLRKGSELGWCKYIEGIAERRRAARDLATAASIKPVYQYSLTGEFIKEWPAGATSAQRELNINKSNISQCCNGKTKTAGGFIWSFTKLK